MLVHLHDPPVFTPTCVLIAMIPCHTYMCALHVQALRSCFPRFAEQEEGRFSQQDAEEAWSELMTTLQHELPGDVVTRLFGIKLTST